MQKEPDRTELRILSKIVEIRSGGLKRASVDARFLRSLQRPRTEIRVWEGRYRGQSVIACTGCSGTGQSHWTEHQLMDTRTG
jgi:hypothetical protein